MMLLVNALSIYKAVNNKVMESFVMKFFKLFLALSLVFTISYLYWSYHTSKSLQEKHDRATLVFEVIPGSAKTIFPERAYEYE